MSKYNLLLKTSWFASDIANYYGISKPYAEKIKSRVIERYGCSPSTEDNDTQKSVRTDDVIKFMGGNNRIEELQVLSLVKQTTNIILEGNHNEI